MTLEVTDQAAEVGETSVKVMLGRSHALMFRFVGYLDLAKARISKRKFHYIVVELKLAPVEAPLRFNLHKRSDATRA